MQNDNSKVKYIDEVDIRDKRILVRVDFNVSLTEGMTIADDARIKQSLPTLQRLLQGNNRLILLSHLGRPEGRDLKFSLKPVAAHLQRLLSHHKITLVEDFLNASSVFAQQKPGEILLLENLRFYPQEKKDDGTFAKALAALGDIYVNDAFGAAHRNDASIVELPKLLPSYGGLLLKKEIAMIDKVVEDPQHPVVAILGGAKTETKLKLITRLVEIADFLLLGGKIATTFLVAEGLVPADVVVDTDEIPQVKNMIAQIREKNTHIVLPRDAVIGDPQNPAVATVKKLVETKKGDNILDIGPETEAIFGTHIAAAKTIIWNGPVGYHEIPAFSRGTEYVYYAITQNDGATSIVGGGDTLAAISKEEYLDKITHISTGGGAMLEYIERGTLPGIEALKLSH